ncbi:aldehyde dehydrogenase family protein, partial [Corynebacterium sp. HMSC076D02]
MSINNDAAKPNDLPEKILHYIDGEFVSSIDGDEFDVLDPVTNQNYIKAASGKPADIDKAVAAAKAAFERGEWSKALPRERARVL